MSSPSALIKVNYLVMRCLHFGSVRGDLQEGYGCASRCQFPLFPSTKPGFLCFFGLLDPRFRGFRAQNRGFCALFAFGTLVFGHFEHKIGVFVLFWAAKPTFLGFPRTKSAFLCACYGNTGLWKQKSAHIFCFCALLIYYSGVTAAVVASGRPSRPDVVTGELPPERCRRSVAAGALLPERCRWSVAAEALLPKRCRRSVTAGALPPEKLRLRLISPPRSLRRLLRHRFCRPAGRRCCCR